LVNTVTAFCDCTCLMQILGRVSDAGRLRDGAACSLGRVSDAGRLRDGAACSAAGVRKPPKEETALGGRVTCRSLELGHQRCTTSRRLARVLLKGDLRFRATCNFNGLSVAEIARSTTLA